VPTSVPASTSTTRVAERALAASESTTPLDVTLARRRSVGTAASPCDGPASVPSSAGRDASVRPTLGARRDVGGEAAVPAFVASRAGATFVGGAGVGAATLVAAAGEASCASAAPEVEDATGALSAAPVAAGAGAGTGAAGAELGASAACDAGACAGGEGAGVAAAGGGAGVAPAEETGAGAGAGAGAGGAVCVRAGRSESGST
jgi:hypothetical protein